MTRRFYPRYSGKRENSEELYEVIDGHANAIVSHAMPHDAAEKMAKAKNESADRAAQQAAIDAWSAPLSGALP